ncbi:replication factor C subunit 2 [Dorcoceras hygrometricum]|uniref:Replication factor C subunit 2 n=1 Tax=Dorcoceras hygrometricum TaxID=472368 RepID=A0A2Z7CWK6_9LAMI|nr:replication factor C subunit 2 [Dorcoceras hygrometricum]
MRCHYLISKMYAVGCRSGSAPRQAAEEQNFTGMRSIRVIQTNYYVSTYIGEQNFTGMRSIRVIKQIYVSTYIGCLASHLSGTCAWLQPVFQEPGASRLIAVTKQMGTTWKVRREGSSIDHQVLSVIPRGSWGDVVRCFTMVQWLPLPAAAAAGTSPGHLGFPGYSAGRGIDPARGAPGGG